VGIAVMSTGPTPVAAAAAGAPAAAAAVLPPVATPPVPDGVGGALSAPDKNAQQVLQPTQPSTTAQPQQPAANDTQPATVAEPTAASLQQLLKTLKDPSGEHWGDAATQMMQLVLGTAEADVRQALDTLKSAEGASQHVEMLEDTLMRVATHALERQAEALSATETVAEQKRQLDTASKAPLDEQARTMMVDVLHYLAQQDAPAESPLVAGYKDLLRTATPDRLSQELQRMGAVVERMRTRATGSAVATPGTGSSGDVLPSPRAGAAAAAGIAAKAGWRKPVAAGTAAAAATTGAASPQSTGAVAATTPQRVQMQHAAQLQAVLGSNSREKRPADGDAVRQGGWSTSARPRMTNR